MSRNQLGDLQHAIMQVLWTQGEATAADVHRALLDERGLAPTTIATMLAKMERKGVVSHRTEGRKYVYHPTVSETEVRRSMLGDLTDRLFDGSVAAVVTHLLEEREIDARELDELRRLIAEAQENQEAQ
jgi:predicted transcriptional regulator